MKKIVILVLAIVSSMTISLAANAAEDTYNCYFKNVPGNASVTVTASSVGEAVDKAKQGADSLKRTYNLSYLDVGCVKRT